MAQSDVAVVARNALEFLKRVQLAGQEVPAFVDVVNWLRTFAEQPQAAQQGSAASGD